MRTGLLCAVTTATLAVFIGAACTGRLEPAHAAKTPDEIKQFANVTDGVVSVLRNLPRSAESSSEFRATLWQLVAALAAARNQFQSHSNAIVNTRIAATLGCVDAHSIEILDLQTMIERIDKATLQSDEAALAGRKALLMGLAQDATECAYQLTAYLYIVKDPDTVSDIAIVIGQAYAMATVLRAASGLRNGIGVLLKDQIAAYEVIVARLGPDHQQAVVMDALPKLKSALSLLATEAA